MQCARPARTRPAASGGAGSLEGDALPKQAHKAHHHASVARGERPRSLAVLGTRLTTQTAPPQGGWKADTSARRPSPALVRDGAGMLPAKSRACSVIPFAIARECEARKLSRCCRAARQPEAAAALRSSRSRSRGRAERGISMPIRTAGLSQLCDLSAGLKSPRNGATPCPEHGEEGDVRPARWAERTTRPRRSTEFLSPRWPAPPIRRWASARPGAQQVGAMNRAPTMPDG